MKILMERNVVEWNGHEVKNRNDLIHCFIINYYLCNMEKLMFDFLDDLDPNMFRYRTKFGVIPHFSRGGTYLVSDEKSRQIIMLCKFFSCEYNYGLSVYERWMNSKPIYVRMKNSTTEIFVLESKADNCITTEDMTVTSWLL